MSHSMRIKAFFLGCVIGFALMVRLLIALPLVTLGPMGGLADIANELSIIVALFAAYRLTERFNSYHTKRTVIRLMETGWVKWLAELQARKSMSANSVETLLKNVA
jgi:hypothetical protein